MEQNAAASSQSIIIAAGVQSTNKYASRGDGGYYGGCRGVQNGRGNRKASFHFLFFSITRKRKQHIVLYTAAKFHVVSCEPNEPMGRLLIKIDQKIIVAMRLPWMKKNADLEPKTEDEPHDSNFIEKKPGLSKMGA